MGFSAAEFRTQAHPKYTLTLTDGGNVEILVCLVTYSLIKLGDTDSLVNVLSKLTQRSSRRDRKYPAINFKPLDDYD